MAHEEGKQAVALAAAQRVEAGMVVGLGTGSTASRFVEALARRVREEGLSILGVPTSRASMAQAESLGIPIAELSRDTRPDLTIDGADEVDPALHLIKGGGGALVQEKLVAVSSRDYLVIVDQTKEVDRLGAFPLPVAVVPYGWDTTLERLQSAYSVPAARRERDGQPVVTDDGLFIIDLQFGAIDDPVALEHSLKGIVGVAESGLFVGMARHVLVGCDDGSVREL